MRRPAGLPALDVTLAALALGHAVAAFSLAGPRVWPLLASDPVGARAMGALLAALGWLLLLCARWTATASRRWLGRLAALLHLLWAAVWLAGPLVLSLVRPHFSLASALTAGALAAAALWTYGTSPAREGTGLRRLFTR